MHQFHYSFAVRNRTLPLRSPDDEFAPIAVVQLAVSAKASEESRLLVWRRGSPRGDRQVDIEASAVTRPAVDHDPATVSCDYSMDD